MLKQQGGFPDVFGGFSSHAEHKLSSLVLLVPQGFTFICEENQAHKRPLLVIRTHDASPRFVVIFFSPILARSFQGFSERLSSAYLSCQPDNSADCSLLFALHTEQVCLGAGSISAAWQSACFSTDAEVGYKQFHFLHHYFLASSQKKGASY